MTERSVHDLEKQLAELAEREAHFHRLVEQAPDMFYTYSSTRGVLYWSPQVERVLGFTGAHAETDPHVWNSAIHPEDRPSVAQAIARSADGTPFDLTYRITTPDGRLVWLRDRSTRIERLDDEVIIEGMATDITAERQAQADTDRERARSRTYMDIAGVIILALDSTGRITEINRAGEELLGWSRDELIGRNWFDEFLPEHGQARTRWVFGGLLDGQGEQHAQVYGTVVTRAGDHRTVLWRNTLIRGDDGTALGTLSSGLDITEQERLARHARDREQTAQRYLDIAGVMILALSDDGTIVLLNRVGAEILGLDQQQAVGRNWFNTCIAEDERDQVHEVFDRIMHGEMEGADEYDNTIVRPDGQRRLIHWRNTWIRDSDGSISGTLSSGEDVTEQRRARQDLAASEERFRTLYESVQAGVVVQAASGEILHANQIAADIFGMRTDDITGRTSADSIWKMIDESGIPVPGEQHPSMLTLRTGEPLRGQVRGLFSGDPDRTRWILVNTEPLWNQQHTRVEQVIVTFVDITHQIHTDRQLDRMRWLLEHDDTPPHDPPPSSYGDVTALNTDGEIKQSVPAESMHLMLQDCLALLDTSIAVYERNGDYAAGMFASQWCRMLDEASRRRCDTDDNAEALRCGAWLCHECCWNESATPALKTGTATDVACAGGVRLYAAPIVADSEVVGALNIGYGSPPSEPDELSRLADQFGLPLEEVQLAAAAYRPRPPFIVDLAKRRAHSVARHIGLLVERRRADARLQEEQARYQTLFDGSPQPIMLFDEDATIVMFNHVAAANLGTTPEAVVGRPYADLVPAFGDIAHRRIRRALQGGEAFVVEDRFDLEDGPHWWQTAIAPVPQRVGGKRLVQFIGTDITEQRLSRERLRESELFLNRVGEMARVGGWSYEVDTQAIYWTLGVKQIYGVNEDFEPDLDTALAGFQGEHRERIGRAFERALTDGTPYDLELAFVSANGTHRWVRSVGTPETHEGRVVRVIGTFQDITDQYRMRAELQRSEEKFRRLFEQSNDAVLIHDRHGQISDVNERACQMLGYDHESLCVMSLANLHPAEEQKRVPGLVQQALDTGSIRFESVMRRGDGSLVDVDISARVVDADNGMVQGIVRDISEQKRIKEQLEAVARFPEENQNPVLRVSAQGTLMYANDAAVSRLSDWGLKDGAAAPEELRSISDAALEAGHAVTREATVDDHIYSFSTVPLRDSGYVNLYGRDITAQRAGERALAESENRFRTLFETAGEAILVMRGTTFIDCNPRATEMFGFAREDLLNARAYDSALTPERQPDGRDSKDKATEIMARALAGEPQTFDWVHLRADGTPFDTEVTLNRMEIGDDVLVLAFVRDMTERTRWEHALQESEATARGLLDGTREGLFLLDLEGRFRMANQTGAERLGVTPEELVGKKIYSFFPRQTAAIRRTNIEEAIRTRSPIQTEDARGPYTFMNYIQPVVGADGTVNGVAVFAQDITRRMQAEHALRSSLERFRTMFDLSPYATVLLDLQLRILECNRAFGRTFAVPGGPLRALGKGVLTYASPEGVERLENLIVDARRVSSAVGPREISLLRRKRPFPAEVIATLITDPGSEPMSYLVMATDITTRKEAERTVVETSEQLRQLTEHVQNMREEERTTIAREIHDQLGQALTALKMDLAWLGRRIPERDSGTDARVSGMEEILDDTIQRVKRITADLRPGVLDDLGLVAALQWLVDDFGRRAGIACTVHATIDDQRLPEAVRTVLYRVTQESLTNVARHAEADEVKVVAEEHDNVVKLEIRDNGRGITPEEGAKPTSFGLMGIRERVRGIGGTVEFFGEPDSGTRVCVMVPLQQQDDDTVGSLRPDTDTPSTADEEGEH